MNKYIYMGFFFNGGRGHKDEVPWAHESHNPVLQVLELTQPDSLGCLAKTRRAESTKYPLGLCKRHASSAIEKYKSPGENPYCPDSQSKQFVHWIGGVWGEILCWELGGVVTELGSALGTRGTACGHFYFSYYLFIYWLDCMACGFLVPWPGI